LSVFAGGWTLEAAVAVIGDGYDEYAMLAVLSRLADHSLIASQTAQGEATRYGMLETVRHYAQERLSESGEAPTTRDRHLAHFLALAQTAELGLGGPEQRAWQELLSREFENLVTAHAWCDQSESGAESGLQLVAALRPYLGEPGLYVLGERLSSQALARAGAQVPNLARCRALAAAGVLVFFLGRYDESRAHADASLALATALQDASQEAMAHWIIGFTNLAGGLHAEARASFERSLALSRSTQNSRQLTRTLIGLAELARTEGDLDRALQLNEEIFVLHRERGDLGGMAVDLANLTMTTLDLGLATRARAYLVQAIELADRLGRDRQRIAPLFCAAGLAVSQRHWTQAARFIGAMQGICEPMSYQVEPADMRFVTTTVDATRVALGNEAFETAAAGGRALSGERALADVRAWLDAVGVQEP